MKKVNCKDCKYHENDHGTHFCYAHFLIATCESLHGGHKKIKCKSFEKGMKKTADELLKEWQQSEPHRNKKIDKLVDDYLFR